MALGARLIIATIITGFLLPQASWGSVRSYLNRYTLSTDDTVQMTIEATQPGSVERPDLTALRSQFIILGQKNMTISRRIDGVPNTTLRWHLLLQPRFSGELTIPSFLMGGEQSNPITITVTPGQTNRSTYNPPNLQSGSIPEVVIGPNGSSRIEANNAADVRDTIRIRTSVEPNEAYVGSQLIYTATLTYQTEPQKPLLIAAPTLGRSLVLPLGEENVRDIRLQGENYIERSQRYVIFPEEVGSQLIDPPILSAGSLEDADTISLAAPPPAESVEILPRTLEDTPWLPSTAVTLTDNSSVPSEITPGTEWVREVTLTAQGVPASELPPLFTQPIDGADTEILSMELTESFDENGLVGHRTETQLVKAQHPGELILPAIEVIWWDVNQDQEAIAQLLPRSFAVIDPSNATSTTQRSRSVPANASNPPLNEGSNEVSQDTPQNALSVNNFLLWGLGAFALVATLFGLTTWVRLRKIQAEYTEDREMSALDRQRALDLEELKQHEDRIRHAEAQTFTALMDACHAGNAQAAYDALIAWGELTWPDAHIYNARDVSSAARNKTLEFAIIDLEQHLYNQRKGDVWMGDLVENAVTSLRERRGFAG
jgi:hypothetical protein